MKGVLLNNLKKISVSYSGFIFDRLFIISTFLSYFKYTFKTQVNRIHKLLIKVYKSEDSNSHFGPDFVSTWSSILQNIWFQNIYYWFNDRI